jgi:hypothetical protein
MAPTTFTMLCTERTHRMSIRIPTIMARTIILTTARELPALRKAVDPRYSFGWA